MTGVVQVIRYHVTPSGHPWVDVALTTGGTASAAGGTATVTVLVWPATWATHGGAVQAGARVTVTGRADELPGGFQVLALTVTATSNEEVMQQGA